jgi:hypothetical protein
MSGPISPGSTGGRGYCLRCGHRLDVNPVAEPGESRCGRCGLPFMPDRPATYRHAPPVHRGWRVALLVTLLTLISFVSYVFIRADGNSMGSALFLAVPFSLGAMLGFSVPASVWLSILLGLFATPCLVFLVIAMNLSGLFCGALLGVIFLGPMLVGCFVGWLIKMAAGEAAWDRRKYAFLGVFVILPFGTDGVERHWPMGEVVVEVSTSATFDAAAGDAWDSVLFYEEVTHRPPFLLTLALPRPIRAEGRRAVVGDEQRCVYDRGHLIKRITRLDPPRLLAFDVVEQHVHFEHDVELRDGSFIVQPLGDHQARVVLTTRYRRLLRPRWLWEPIEHTVIHTLHEHVLEGMRRRAERP